ncbi:MAG: TIGR04283 family arsenosugar biosynthesis glycosyltransferase [Planctomycetaceae bacterium]|nr:TIGR04283 family arsenosugar biosynthesis glycosyltransferase [Planctomycetaceae bacterium]
MNVSVVIPTLNEERQIAACLRSVRQAGATEIIVADGGSTDQTVMLAQDHAQVIEAPRGRAAQQNAGARRATGDVILFVHADCRLTTTTVEKAATMFRSDESVVAGCFHQHIDHSAWKYGLVAAGNAWRVRCLGWAYGDQGICVRRVAFEQAGGFPDLQFMEDLFLMKQLKRRGRIRLLDASIIVSARRWEKRGLLRQTLRNLSLVTAAQLGISPNRLARFYPNER